jgi:uncharacterized protein YdhG (YjbR/CyaY superfamily)
MSGSIENYLNSLPEDRRETMNKLRDSIRNNIPKGFSEQMSYGMIGYVVPHALYPAGYHTKPTDPLPFLQIASQKTCVALYHMGLYADEKLLNWFVEAYKKECKTKLDMGKSCIRFKMMDEIPFALIGKLSTKMTPTQWIERYESAIKKSK